MPRTFFPDAFERRGSAEPPLDAPYLGELPASTSQLVFIMGCHRSGTSMLYHLLAYTGQLDYVSAYDIVKYDELLYNRITGREAQVKADLQRVLQQETTRGLDDLPVGVDLPEEYRFLMPQEQRAIVINIWKRLEELFFKPHLKPNTIARFLEVCRKKRFLAGMDRPLVLKNPSDHYFNFAAVHQMLPQAKFVFIHRHPLHMFNSYLHGFPALLTQHSNYAALIDPRYETLFGRLPLRRWLFLRAFRSDMTCRVLMIRFIESYQYYLANIGQLPPEQYVSMRYEDLCADPVDCLSRIAARLRLDFIPRVPRAFVAPRRLPVLERVSRHYASRIADIAPYLTHCNYTAWPEHEAATSPAPADEFARGRDPHDSARVGTTPA